ncbi:transient receptor potential cation channel subfamily M member 2-like [Alosa sapidissima]|uniref:transient receptor potential cation channel subfamily M member 2-like n=1 Tax=Alosa sapidissima TaxID=34773 RepID=UPI001C0A04C0|nr:transient receptor potential cation channel subfamily M member 2-like [Alosa sapidissima]
METQLPLQKLAAGKTPKLKSWIKENIKKKECCFYVQTESITGGWAGAWIITGGTHTGVMKHVGMAVRDYTLSSNPARGEIVVIGVATWGTVHKHQSLVHPEGCFPAHYTLDERSQGRLSCLDSNHSHFLLVDDGTHGHYGVENRLRSRLEKHLENRESDVKIPVVCVVLDGGLDTLNTIYSAMRNGTPCVVLEGSGRLADVIANAARKPESQVTPALIQRHMKSFFGQEYESCKDKVNEWVKKIQDIIRMPHLTVFSMDKDKNSDVDVAILQTILKQGVFSECHCENDQRSQTLLIRISPSWGETTCLHMAVQADDKSFVAHSGVQALLTQIWFGKLAVDTPFWKILLCMLFFPLIYTDFITYRQSQHHGRALRGQARPKRFDKDTEREAMMNEKTASLADICDPQDSDELKPLSCRARLGSFYAAPQVKFFWNIASYFGFLFLFSIVLMIDFQSTPSWREWLLYVWVTSLVFEEVRQLFDDPDGFGFRKNARMYMNDRWNILDMASILLFIAGLACRWISSAFYAGKVIFCIDFIIFSLRLMAIFTISRTLGPKIIIVKRMMMDLFFFMIMLSIWVVAYGVAKQGILIHNEERLDWIFRGAVYEPYLIIFGNFPTNIDKAEFDMPTCTVNGTDPMLPKCPMLNANQIPAIPEWLTIIMLCVYLLFANILLLNLLIAIFNYTFQEVQDNTDKIWKFQRYDLIKEYHSRPALPPPFILLSHLLLLFRRFVMRQHPQKHKQFRKRLSKTDEEELMSWEAIMKDKYLATQLQKTSESMEHRILAMADRVASMSELLEREHDRGTTAKRLVQLEEQVSQSAKALQWIMDTLKAQGYQSKEEPPTMCE